MAKLIFATSMIVCVTALCGDAVSDSSTAGPAYIGDRAADPEDETFAYLVKTPNERLLAFVGPARNVGPVTSDAEKDTFAYRAFLAARRDGHWSFVGVREP